MPNLSNLHIKDNKVLISQIYSTLQAYTTAFGTVLLCMETTYEKEEES